MFMPWISGGVILVGMPLLAMLGNAALPRCETSDGGSLRGSCLLRRRRWERSAIYRTVVLIVRHMREVPLGMIINRSLEECSLASLLEVIGEPDKPQAHFVSSPVVQ
jgi:putative AlgH/UPF0301 family transcriptional regulator